MNQGGFSLGRSGGRADMRNRFDYVCVGLGGGGVDGGEGRYFFVARTPLDFEPYKVSLRSNQLAGINWEYVGLILKSDVSEDEKYDKLKKYVDSFGSDIAPVG